VIAFNAAFESKLRRIKVMLVSEKDAQQSLGAAGAASGVGSGGSGGGGGSAGDAIDEMGSGVTAEGIPVEVEDRRRYQTEAAIVRIMKARKTLVHNELIAEVMRQLSHLFSPTVQVRPNRPPHRLCPLPFPPRSLTTPTSSCRLSPAAVDPQMHRTAHRARLHPARPGGLAAVQLRRLGLTAPNHRPLPHVPRPRPGPAAWSAQIIRFLLRTEPQR
jgi:hypothetical protein